MNILLNDKLSKIISGPLWKVKNDEKVIQMMTKLINGMKELIKLAEKHGIEEALFHQSNLVKIYDLIGKGRQISFVEQNIDKEMTLKQEWQNIIDFLHKELRSKEKLFMCEKFKLENNEKTTTDNEKRKAYVMHVMSELPSKDTKCVLCSNTDHGITVTRKGKFAINYFACPKFAEMQPNEKLNKLKTKDLCFWCQVLKRVMMGFVIISLVVHTQAITNLILVTMF